MAENHRTSRGLGVTLLLAFLGLAAGYFFMLAGDVEARTPRGPSLRDIQEKAEEIEEQEMTIAELIARIEVLGEICDVNTDVNVDCALACESDCCFPKETAGCDDTGCEETVCTADPFCCDNFWDSLCASAAVDLCGDLCTECDVPTGACCMSDFEECLQAPECQQLTELECSELGGSYQGDGTSCGEYGDICFSSCP